MIMKRLLIINMAALVFSCTSSQTVVVEPLATNPTFYVFSKSEQEVKKAIVEALGGHKSSKKNKFDKYFLSEYPKGNFTLMPNWGNPSKVYFRKNGEPYFYSPGKIQIAIDSIAENATKATIIVVKPKVETRLTLLPTLPHLVRSQKYKTVLATTVEEYEILLMIGKELEEENMPELKIPKRVVF